MLFFDTTLDLSMNNSDAMMDSEPVALTGRRLGTSRHQAGTAVTGWGLLIVVAFCLATLLQLAAYRSVAPALVATAFLVLGYVAFHERSPWGSRSACFAFVLIFTLCYFWSGVAAIFANYLDDPIQRSDAEWFYELATTLDDGLSLDELRGMTSGAGAVYIWRLLYRLSSAIGFEKGIYIAVASNTFFVALAGVACVKTAALIFGENQRKVKNMGMLFAFSGICWLFASVLLRDSTVLLLNTLLIYAWVRVLMRPTWRAATWLFAFSVFSVELYAYLRTEFLFVPFALLLAGIASFFVSGQFFRVSLLARVLSLSLIMLCTLVAVVLLGTSVSITSYLGLVASGSQQYSDYANSLDINGSSLGVSYIVNQPLPIRLGVGTFYLQVFPVPFWSGFSEGDIYHLLKSLNAIFMWFVFPLAVLGLYRTRQIKADLRKLALVFLSIVYAGFTLAIAGSSLETRHLGSFIAPLLILAIVPNLASVADRSAYLRVLGAWLALNALVHLAWAILKLT